MSGPVPRDESARAGAAAAAGEAPDTPMAADYSISMLRANLAGLPLFMIMMGLVVAPFVLSVGIPGFILGVNRSLNLWTFLLWIAVGTLAHEALHGIGWVVAGKQSFRSVKFGLHWKTLTPYAHFTEPITASAYRIGIVLPGIVVGLGPALAGYALNDAGAILFGGLFFGAAAGDALGLWAVRNIPAGTLVLDHPTRVGCRIVSSSEIRP